MSMGKQKKKMGRQKMKELYNHSNNHPVNEKLIVFIDTIQNIKDIHGNFRSKGGIIMTDNQRNAEAYAVTSGIVLEMGGSCFQNKVDKPQIGDRVTFKAYAGIHVDEDGNFYRILEDKEIHAIYSKTK